MSGGILDRGALAPSRPRRLARGGGRLARVGGRLAWIWGARHVEWLWGAFAAGCYAAMIIWPSWETIPFHLIWLSLIVMYGFRVWPLRPTMLLLTAVMVMTAVAVSSDAMQGIQLWGELYEVPLMGAVFLAMVWHARRRMDAIGVAERRAEERRSLLERQERFLHDASHELRTPMTIARGHLELLRAAGGRTPEVAVALDELARIDDILTRLLLLANADQDDFLQTGEIALESLLEDVFMRWAEVAPRSWRLGELVVGRLTADQARLRSALDALLENAVKYSSINARIEVRSRLDGYGRVAIEIEDEGCGVPPEALTRIFERFARADPARTRSAGGVGLGLAIVDAIAKAHGGSCTVTSTGHGAVFTLHFPGFRPAGMPEPMPAQW